MTAEKAAEAGKNPRPEEASGVRVRREEPGRWVWLPRIGLFPLRLAATAVMAPIVGLAYLYEYFDVRDRFYRTFFNDTGTIGVYPIADFESGFGIDAGARFVYRELLDSHGTLGLRASFGTSKPQTYELAVNTGDYFDRVGFELRGSYESLASQRFFGIGNADAVPPPPALIDPLVDDTAVPTRYSEKLARARLSGLFRVIDHLDLGLHAQLSHTRFGDDPKLRGDANIVDVYNPADLIGFEDNVTAAYLELELLYDSRRTTRYYLSKALTSTGWVASVFGGLQSDVGGAGRAPFGRLGLDLQRYVDLYGGDRVLVTRLYLDTVAGALDDIPFTDLPALGGSRLLRGYQRDRFRDRRAGMLSFEYMYPISSLAAGYVFVEGGRVWRDWDDLRSTRARDLRVAFGAGIQLHGQTAFRARLSLASSIDGGVQLWMSFDPAFAVRARNTLF